MKTKVEKSKLVDAAGVKKSTFDRLVAEMDKHAENIMSKFFQYYIVVTKFTCNVTYTTKLHF